MSERILKALMHLFAIIAKVEVDAKTYTGRQIVEAFLRQQLNLELVNDYLADFDIYLEEHQKVSRRAKGTKKRKRTSLSSVKVLMICEQINKELTQKQKIIVLIRLIEFVFATGEPSPQEMEFLTTVAATFNIPDEEYKNCLKFIATNSTDEFDDKSEFLFIDNQKEYQYEKCKHIYSENMYSPLLVLSIKSVKIYIIRYLGTEEILLNGQQALLQNRVYVLNAGSSIRSSKVKPIYYSDILSTFLRDTVKSNVLFEVKDLEYKFSNDKYGIHKLNIIEESGKLIGIMGASGAGKTTLLNILNGNHKPTKGNVLINGIDLHNDEDEVKGVIGHISQDDLLIEDLTVYQNLFYNAKLCFKNLSNEDIEKLVLKTLQSLGLYEVRDLKVGSPLNKKISGGQRKRLNISLELIREPTILFVDEPTSGLSSRDSENVMDLLKELALKGKLIFVVIHQPSSDIFKMFDKLIILDTGGYISYYGNPVDSIVYFKSESHYANYKEAECQHCGNVNPEQIFNILEAKVVDEFGNLTKTRKMSPKQWYESYNKKFDNESKNIASYSPIPKSKFKIPNSFSQFKVFVKRDVLSKIANTQYVALNLLESPVLAMLLAYVIKFFNVDADSSEGYIYRDNENIPIYLFMCVIVALFLGLMVSAEEIFKDQKILKREKFLNLSRSSYLVSKVVIMFAISAIQTFTFIFIGNAILGIKSMTFDYFLILFSTSAFANMLGLNISSSFNSVVTIYILIPLIIIPQLLLSGVMVSFNKLNPSISHPTEIPIIGNMMTSRWAYEAIAVNQFKNNEYEKLFYPYDKAMSIANFKKTLWISKLKGKIDHCEAFITHPEKKESVVNDINLLKNEITKHQTELLYEQDEIRNEIVTLQNQINDDNKDIKELYTKRIKKLKLLNHNYIKPLLTFTTNDSLSFETITPTIIASCRKYLNDCEDFYKKKDIISYKDKDRLIYILENDADSKDIFIQNKKDYQNKSLNDYVKNSNELNRIVELDGELFQQYEPIYRDPIHRGNISAHYYAPRKKIFSNYYDTYWINFFVIWLMTIALYITLYYDVLKKLLELSSKYGSLLADLINKKLFKK